MKTQQAGPTPHANSREENIGAVREFMSTMTFDERAEAFFYVPAYISTLATAADEDFDANWEDEPGDLRLTDVERAVLP